MNKKNYFICRSKCPVCNSDKIKSIYTNKFTESPIKEYLEVFYSTQGKIEFKYLKDKDFVLELCLNCKTIFQKYIPNSFLMKKLYDEWISPEEIYKREVKIRNFDKQSNYASEIIMLINYFNKSPEKLKFLDFGMGWSNWCIIAKAFGCDVYGVELSKPRIKYAKSIGIKIISYKEIHKYKFDFINTDQVFEHISNPLETIKYLRKSINKNGLIRISVPNGNNVLKKIKKLDWTPPNWKNSNATNPSPISPLEHINCYTTKSLILMAEKIKLKKVNIPLHIQYVSMTNLNTIKKVAKYFIKPLYSNYVNKTTNIFFEKD